MITVITPKIASKELQKEPEVAVNNNAKAISEVMAILAVNDDRIHQDDIIAIGNKYPNTIVIDSSRSTEVALIGIRNTSDFLLLKRNFFRHDYSILPLENENDFFW